MHSIQALGRQGDSIHAPSVSPRASEALLSVTKLSTPPHPPTGGPPRRDSVSRLETTVSRISLRTLGPAANQNWDQPQSISECPGARRQHSPPGIGARGCPGNPKPPSIIILAFVIRQTGPWTIGCFLGKQLPLASNPQWPLWKAWHLCSIPPCYRGSVSF